MQNGTIRKSVQFGAFELRLGTGELRKHGVKIKLQGKPFQILQALLERPGEVVTREELQSRLWAADTFVDFESGLNTAANRLRITLGDSADNPRYVETLARSGYRFIAPINEVTPEAPEATHDVQPASNGTAVIHAEPAAAPPLPAPAKREARWWIPMGLLALAVAGGAIYWATHQAPGPPTYHQITFRRGMVGSARFGADGQSIVYCAKWSSDRQELFLASMGSPESRALGFPRSCLAGISRSGELALMSYDPATPFAGAKLSRVPLNGGAPLSIAERVNGAEWLPDGEGLAVVRNSSQETTVEAPLGKVIYKTTGWITNLRISPKGDAFAFLEHPVAGDDSGMVKLLDMQGASRTLSAGWASSEGLAWSPSGKEVWFTASRAGIMRSLYAVSQAGRLRLIEAIPGTLKLFDISRTGRVLLSRDTMRMGMAGIFSGQNEEKDLSWFDWSRPQEISADGNLILFDETGEGGGAHYAVYVHNNQTNGTMRVGDGRALGLSPDNKWALTIGIDNRAALTMAPLDPGQPRRISGEGLQYQWARFFPDGKKLLVGGNYPGEKLRLFTQPAAGGKPAPLKQERYLYPVALSPDGTQIAGTNWEHKLELVSVAGGASRTIDMPMPSFPLQWSRDGKFLYVQQRGAGMPLKIFKLNLATGTSALWKEIAPADESGLVAMLGVVLAADEQSYVYATQRILSELYAVDGWN